MNHVGFLAAPKGRCIRTRMRAMPRSMPKRAACTDARRCAPTRIPGPMPIHMYRRPSPFLRTTMGNDGVGAPSSAAFLARMLQFGDLMFPIGGFSFSCGLESAIQEGVVADAATLHAFARTAVEQAARGDGIALIAAHRAAAAGDVDALIRIDEQVHARKLSDEMRTMSVRMGKKFTEMGVQVIGAPLLCTWRECIETSATPGCYPVALAMNFAVQGLSAREAFVVHQYGRGGDDPGRRPAADEDQPRRDAEDPL